LSEIGLIVLVLGLAPAPAVFKGIFAGLISHSGLDAIKCFAPTRANSAVRVVFEKQNTNIVITPTTGYTHLKNTIARSPTGDAHLRNKPENPNLRARENLNSKKSLQE
jgi:hypothetical protein